MKKAVFRNTNIALHYSNSDFQITKVYLGCGVRYRTLSVIHFKFIKRL